VGNDTPANIPREVDDVPWEQPSEDLISPAVNTIATMIKMSNTFNLTARTFVDDSLCVQETKKRELDEQVKR